MRAATVTLVLLSCEACGENTEMDEGMDVERGQD